MQRASKRDVMVNDEVETIFIARPDNYNFARGLQLAPSETIANDSGDLHDDDDW